jgi:hypothetical protein
MPWINFSGMDDEEFDHVMHKCVGAGFEFIQLVTRGQVRLTDKQHANLDSLCASVGFDPQVFLLDEKESTP